MSPKSAEERDNEEDEIIEGENLEIDGSDESSPAGYFPDNVNTVCWFQSRFSQKQQYL